MLQDSQTAPKRTKLANTDSRGGRSGGGARPTGVESTQGGRGGGGRHQQQQQRGRWSSGRGRVPGGRGANRNHNSGTAPIQRYYHSSMLEDPWQQLMTQSAAAVGEQEVVGREEAGKIGEEGMLDRPWH